MIWTELLNENRVAAEPPTKQEMDNLRSIVRLRISDLHVKGLSHEQRFIIAYDAARTLSLMVVRAAGYRPRKHGGHFNTFAALEAADPVFAQQFAYFNICRMKRNDSEYDFAGSITVSESDELIEAVTQFAPIVEAWIGQHQPALV
jgi:hypothetical protein